MQTADVVVVGAGVNGLSTAFHLARAGVKRVVVVERRHLAAGATGKSGALRGRSLLAERRNQDSAFTLRSVVLEYVTDRPVEDVTREITTNEPGVLLSHALVKATAKDYVRRSQERLIAGPLLEGLVAASGDTAAAERCIVEQLSFLHTRSRAHQGYGPGNLVNLLRLLRGNLRGVDLSGLAIRQAHLQEVEAQDASLADAHLTESVFPGAFAYPTPVALSADGRSWPRDRIKDEVHAWRVADRTPVLAATGHAGATMGLALSGDGGLLASGGLDWIVKVWETATGKLQASIAGHSGGVWGVALSQDGRLVATGGGDVGSRSGRRPAENVWRAWRGTPTRSGAWH